jgi:uncharacterized protein (TIGR02118 family)
MSDRLKVTWFARFRPDLTRAQGRRHWETVHGPLGAAVPQIERYIQNHAGMALGPEEILDEPAAFNGYSSAWYADRAAFDASLLTPEWDAIGADSTNVFDHEWFWGMSAHVSENVIVDLPVAPFKVVWVMRFPAEVRADPERLRAAHDYWIETHGGHFGRAVPGMGRYVQNHVVANIGEHGIEDGELPKFDGFSECWFEDREAFERMMATPEWLAMNHDAETLFDLEYNAGGMNAVLEEVVIKDDAVQPA